MNNGIVTKGIKGFQKGHPAYWKGKTLPKKTKEKMSLAKKGKSPENLKSLHTKVAQTKRIKNLKRGDGHYNWKGGITPINHKIRTSLEYRLWRTAVFERDKYMCIWGGKEHGNKLNADHIKSFSQFPELRFAIDNGRTLCIDCHKTTDSWGVKKQ